MGVNPKFQMKKTSILIEIRKKKQGTKHIYMVFLAKRKTEAFTALIYVHFGLTSLLVTISDLAMIEIPFSVSALT